MILIQISPKSVPESPTEYFNTASASNYGLARNRRQAITWTNVDQYPWRHMESPEQSELCHKWRNN